MRILVIGGGEVGYALARGLAAEHEIFVVDQSAEVAERFRQLDVEFITGSATSAEVLRRAGAERCDLMIACTGLDEVNLVACAIAKRLGLSRTICFVSSDDILDADDSSDSMREHFGIERVVWPEAQGQNARPRDAIGFVFQEPTLMPWATVWSNVYLPLRLDGIGKAKAAPRVAAALQMVGLAGAVKFFLWPIGLWFVAIGRTRVAVIAAAFAAASR